MKDSSQYKQYRHGFKTAAKFIFNNVITHISGNKLPTNKEILQLLFHHTRNLNKNIQNSMTDVFNEVRTFWDKAKIPIITRTNCVAKIDRLYNEYRQLQKKTNKVCIKEIENDFDLRLNMLFDIAAKDVLEKLDETSKIFLLGQRSAHRFGFLPLESQVVSTK